MQELSSSNIRMNLENAVSNPSVLTDFITREVNAGKEGIVIVDGSEIDVEITVRFLPASGKRVGKDTQKSILKHLCESTGTSAWYNAPGKYLFDFKEDKFMWGNHTLYFTPSEQLELYRALVQNEAIDRTALRRMRVKFGVDFLKDLV